MDRGKVREEWVQKCLDLSTAHIPSSEPDWGEVVALRYEHGWVVFTQVWGEPSWLSPVFGIAEHLGCTLVKFDCDGPERDDLEKWEW